MMLAAGAALGTAAVLAAAAVGVVTVSVWRRPQRGLLILAALTPFNGMLALVPVGGLAGWKEALIVLTLLSAWRFRGRSDLSTHAPWWPPVALLLAVSTVSALATFGLFGVIAIKVTFFYLTLVAILLWAPFDSTDRDRLVTILMTVGVVTSLVGVAQQVLGPQFLVDIGYSYGQQVRSTGGLFRTFSTFNQPFPFALYVMLALLIGAAVALSDPLRRRNLIFLCFSPIMVLAMGTAVVRASMLGLFLGALWLAVLRFRSALVLMGVGGLLVGVCLPFLPGNVSGVVFSSSSLGERNSGWQQIFSSVFDKPFGQGLGATGAAAERMAAASGESVNQIRMAAEYQPDNYYIKMLVELGPIGLCAIVALFVLALVWTARLSRTLPDPDGAFALGVSASIVAAMAASTVATYFEIFPIDVHFWLFLGVVGCAATQQKSGSARSPFGPTAAASRPISVNS